MKTEVNRRNFIKLGVTGCAFLMAARLNSLNAFDTFTSDNELPDPKILNYCGYKCPDDCQFLQATRENSADLKLKAYENWKIKEKYGVDFDAEKIYCWGCKTKDKPLGIAVSNCPVRNCAIEKGYECCIECDNLAGCEFDLWKNFPDFHKKVVAMQKTFKVSK